MLYIKDVKKKEICWKAFHSAASRLKKKKVFENCKFRKRARNRQPIYYCKDIPEPTSRPPASHRAHTEPLPRQGFFSAHQPTEPPHGLRPIRACFPPPSAHRTLCYSMLYIKTVKKKEICWIAFHLAASRFKKKAVFKNCKFRKRARNTQQRYRCKDMSEPTSSPQSPHRAFGPSGLV